MCAPVRKPAGGSWSASVQTSPAPANAQSLALSVRADGSALAAWSDTRAGSTNSDVWGAAYDPTGQTCRPRFDSTMPQTRQGRPARRSRSPTARRDACRRPDRSGSDRQQSVPLLAVRSHPRTSIGSVHSYKEESNAMNALPRIYADFQKTDDKQRVVLTTVGTKEDLAHEGSQLRDGLRVLLYADDHDGRGNRDDLLVEGIVAFDGERPRWVAVVDWGALRRESEIKEGS